MDMASPKLTLCMGLFSGASLSAAWISARPYDTIGAVCIGTAACALILIVLRFDRTFIKKARRATDRQNAATDPA
jgi:hypothetical protein